MDNGNIINMRSLQNQLISENPDYKFEVIEFIDAKLTTTFNKMFGSKTKEFIVIDKDNIYVSSSECETYSKECSKSLRSFYHE